MPIFEYACEKCRHRFEKIVGGASAPECPACGSRRLERQLSVFAVGSRSKGAAPKSAAAPAGSCGTCGDPRGPGSCSTN
jgi:putative FmdB family regulatory protein